MCVCGGGGTTASGRLLPSSVTLTSPLHYREAIPYEALLQNPSCVLVATPTGGHLGWCSGPDGPTGASWTDMPMQASWARVRVRVRVLVRVFMRACVRAFVHMMQTALVMLVDWPAGLSTFPEPLTAHTGSTGGLPQASGAACVFAHATPSTAGAGKRANHAGDDGRSHERRFHRLSRGVPSVRCTRNFLGMKGCYISAILAALLLWPTTLQPKHFGCRPRHSMGVCRCRHFELNLVPDDSWCKTPGFCKVAETNQQQKSKKHLWKLLQPDRL